jgi:hypothetical protein
MGILVGVYKFEKCVLGGGSVRDGGVLGDGFSGTNIDIVCLIVVPLDRARSGDHFEPKFVEIGP